jgi:predicted nucleotidyltransferase
MDEDDEAYNKMATGQEKSVVDFLSKQEHVKLAYLFGSVAEGKKGKLSDVDLAVFLDESLSKPDRFNLQLKLIYELTGIMKTDKVDLVIMNDAPLSLNYEIIKANHPLLVEDEGKKIDFEHRILSRYLDRRYYEKRWAAEFLKKVAKRGI